MANEKKRNPASISFGNQQSRLPLCRQTFIQRRNKDMGPYLLIYTNNREAVRLRCAIFKFMSTATGQANFDDPAGPRFRVRIPDSESQGIIDFIDWLNAAFRVEKIPPIKESGDIYTDLAIVRAATLLGMGDYVKGMYNFYYTYITDNHLSYSDVDAIVSLTLAPENTLFQRLAWRMGKMHYRGSATNHWPWFLGYLAGHPWLRKAVDAEYARMVEKHGPPPA